MELLCRLLLDAGRTQCLVQQVQNSGRMMRPPQDLMWKVVCQVVRQDDDHWTTSLGPPTFYVDGCLPYEGALRLGRNVVDPFCECRVTVCIWREHDGSYHTQTFDNDQEVT